MNRRLTNLDNMLMKPLALLLLVLSPLSAAAQPSIYGFTLPSWNRDDYDTPGAQQSLSNMAATGAKWVSIIPTWYMKDKNSSEIAPVDWKTASDESVVRVIRRAKSLGLCVALKPHVNVLSGSPTALIAPSDKKKWFAQYERFLLSYARMAQAEHVDLLVIGTELMSMTAGHGRQWKGMIAAARGEYSGKMTYAANWYDFMAMPFWGSLDYVGVDAYFPLPGGSHPRIEQIDWHVYLPLIKAVALVHHKPLLFTEIGISSQKGASLKPWDYHDFADADPKVQEAFFEAFVRVFRKQKNFAGFLQWCWDLNPQAGGPADKSMTVQGKPALLVLERWFAELNGNIAPAHASELKKAAEKVTRMLGEFH